MFGRVFWLFNRTTLELLESRLLKLLQGLLMIFGSGLLLRDDSSSHHVIIMTAKASNIILKNSRASVVFSTRITVYVEEFVIVE